MEKKHRGELLYHLVLLHGASQYGDVGRYTGRTPSLLLSPPLSSSSFSSSFSSSSVSSSSNRMGGAKGGGKDIVQASKDHLGEVDERGHVDLLLSPPSAPLPPSPPPFTPFRGTTDERA